MLVVFFMILITCYCFECVNLQEVDGECCSDDVITSFNKLQCTNNNQSINLFCPNDTLQVQYENITKYDHIRHCYRNHKWICRTNITDVFKGGTQQGLVICKEEIEYCEWVERYDNDWFQYLLFISYVFINLLSAFLLIATCISYYFVIDIMNDIQGSCVRHYTLSLGLAHAFTAINVFSVTELVHFICVIYVYLSLYFVLTSFVWMNLLAYGVWRSTKGHSSGCDKRTLIRYYVIGYGLPLIDLIAACVNSFIGNWGTDNLKNNCYAHQTSMMEEFFVIPVFIIMLLNLFYFLDSLKRLWNTAPPSNNTQTTSTAIQVIKFRACLHFKLFVVTGVIWTLVGISFLFDLFSFHIWAIIILVLASCEGIFIFIVLVATRKKVLRGLARRTYFGKNVFPTSWRDFHDSETEEADINVHYSSSSNNHNNFSVNE